MRALPYGSEQRVVASHPLKRFAFGVAGSHFIGARIRYAAILPELRKLAPPGRILDAGSGKGELSFALARRWPSADVLGVEMESALVDHATRVKDRAMPQARVRFERDELPRTFERKFDLVVSVDVLEHVVDDRSFLRCLADAIAPGGSLILHTPATDKRRFLADFEEQDDHVRDGYAKEDLHAMCEDAGLRDVHIRSTFGTLGAIGWEGWALARRGNVLARAALPLWYTLSALDTTRQPTNGLGLLVTARR